jgi:hypothetical protein
MQADDTEEPPDEADELSEIIEFGRRAEDFSSGNVPTNELRNRGAVDIFEKINQLYSKFEIAYLCRVAKMLWNDH